MQSIGILGLSVHDHDAAALARYTVARARRVEFLPELKAALGLSEAVYLATCNRVEVIYREEPGHEPRDHRVPLLRILGGREPLVGEAEANLRHWRGPAAAEHLFRVAAGLESAMLGEREIQGQVREALADARAAATSGVLVDLLLEEALRVARRVHLGTQLGAGRVSLAELAADLILERVRRTPSPVALVGVSAITRRCAEILSREGVEFLIANRTVAHAGDLLLALGGDRGACCTLDEFRARPPRVEALLCATGAAEPVLDRAALERLAAHTVSQEPPLIVDMAIPPDVDPDTARLAQVPRVGMDELNRLAQEGRAARSGAASAADALVEEALRDFRRRLAERALGPVIARINRRYRDTALEGVERLLGRRGVALDAAGREALERWAETLARRFAHLPALGLRGLAAEQGLGAVRSFLLACDEDPAAFAALCETAAEMKDLSDSLALEGTFEGRREPRDRR